MAWQFGESFIVRTASFKGTHLMDYLDDKLTILTGDCLTRLADLHEKSVQTVVTSPPYFGHRDYGVQGQLGRETRPEDFVAALVAVFREIHRVLRDDGTVWLNLGDSYAVNGGARTYGSTDAAVGRAAAPGGPRRAPEGYKNKDLLGIPWQVAFALRADGWYLRSDVIWNQTNPAPESVKDRPTSAHEYIFLLTKKERYYYDAEAVKEPSKDLNATLPLPPRNRRDVWEIAMRPYKGAHFATFSPDLVEPCILAGTSARGQCPNCGTPWQRVISKRAGPTPTADWTETLGWRPDCRHYKRMDEWAALPKQGKTEADKVYQKRISPLIKLRAELLKSWESALTVPCLVLDPFGGSGTTALVANRYGRTAVLIELNPQYVQLALSRLGRVIA
jgi:DNA modification methylase